MPTQISRHAARDFARYLPIDDALFASPVFLTSAGRTTIPPGAAYPAPGHPDLYQFKWQDGRVLPEFSLLWVEAGTGIWETHHGSFPIRAGQVGQVLAGQWHRYRPAPATGWTECWVQFNGRLVHELEAAGVNTNVDDSMAMIAMGSGQDIAAFKRSVAIDFMTGNISSIQRMIERFNSGPWVEVADGAFQPSRSGFEGSSSSNHTIDAGPGKTDSALGQPSH